MSETDSSTLLPLVADIVSAYVSNNSIATADLPALIQSVYSSLGNVDQPEAPVATIASLKATPGQIRKSITHDALISFEDGKAYKTLKRHLTTMGISIDAYKAKWGLPKDYPTTAPSYSEARSAMAKSLGLGRRKGETTSTTKAKIKK